MAQANIKRHAKINLFKPGASSTRAGKAKKRKRLKAFFGITSRKDSGSLSSLQMSGYLREICDINQNV